MIEKSMIERNVVRKRIRQLRREYLRHHAGLLEAWSQEIEHRVLVMNECRKAKRIMCYYALPGEVQTVSLIRALLRENKEVYLPVTKTDFQMDAVRLRDADAVHAGALRVMEPDEGERIDPAQLDLILVPGLAFDRGGGRMGYGAGCYDRFLPGCRALIVGLAFEFQLIGRVKMEAHDVFMQRIITERAVYDCGNRKENEHEAVDKTGI